MNKKILVLILSIIYNISVFGSDQKKYLLIIEKKFNESKNHFELLKSESLAKEALNLSYENNYNIGVIKGNIYLAKISIKQGNYYKAIEYINKAEQLLNKKESINSSVEIYRLKGILYLCLGITELSIKEFRKQLKLSREIKDSHKKNQSIFKAYQNIIYFYSKRDNNDSIWKYLNLEKQILTKLEKKKDFIIYSTSYTQIANQFNREKKIDSAEIYLDKSLKILKKYKSPYLYFTYRKYGDLYNLKGDEQKAIHFYKKSIENSKDLNHINSLLENYKILANYLNSKNINKEEAGIFYCKYHRIKDSLDTENTKATEHIFNQIVHEERVFSNLNYTIIIIIFLIFFSILISYIQKEKLKKRKFNQKLKDIENNYNENLNDNKFDRLIYLLKNNKPEFIIIFEELYPCFIKQLKLLDPNIRNSEISFCAMLYLNFSTKDISEFTFVTTRAVQVRKNRLRKKYKISSNIDLNKWMRNLCNEIP